MKLVQVEIVRTDGSRQQREVPKTCLMEWIRGQIKAWEIDIVPLGDGRVMIVDDSGWDSHLFRRPDGTFELVPLTQRKPTNAAATEMYHGSCWPGVTHQIVGDVVVARDADFA